MKNRQSPKPYDERLFRPSVSNFWHQVEKCGKPKPTMPKLHKIQESIDALAMSRRVLRHEIQMYRRSYADFRTGKVHDKEALRIIRGLEYAAVAVLFMARFFIESTTMLYPEPRSKRMKKGRRRAR